MGAVAGWRFSDRGALVLINKYFAATRHSHRSGAPHDGAGTSQRASQEPLKTPLRKRTHIDMSTKPCGPIRPIFNALSVVGISGRIISRLYGKLVKELEIAVSVSARPDGARAHFPIDSSVVGPTDKLS